MVREGFLGREVTVSWDSGDDENPRTWRVSRPFAKTLHDLRLRIEVRAGRHPVEDAEGVVRYSNAVALDRTKRDFDREYDVLYDVFRQKLQWMRQTLTLRFDVAGEWELELLVSGGSVVVVLGHIENDWVEILAQDIPAFQVADLGGLVRRIQAQMRLRREYHQHLLS